MYVVDISNWPFEKAKENHFIFVYISQINIKLIRTTNKNGYSTAQNNAKKKASK